MGYSSMMPVMSASIDDGKRESGDRWHVMLDDGKPLCRARLSGLVKTTKKGSPNCGTCAANDYPRIYEQSQVLLLSIADGATVRDGPKAYGLYSLFEYALVTYPTGGVASLTTRGSLVVNELRAPALWRGHDGLVHARNGLAGETRCNKGCNLYYYVDLVTLREEAKRLKLTKPTCLRCGVA